jgi:uncharacterized protein YjiS (DUF1127 family)
LRAVVGFQKEKAMTHSASGKTTGTVTGTTFTFALMGMAVRAASRMMAALKNRRQVVQLHQLDDRALKDIGLMRSDVRAALSTPLYCDPSHHLMEVAGGGRSGAKPVVAIPTQDLNRLRRPDAVVANGLPQGAARA